MREHRILFLAGYFFLLGFSLLLQVNYHGDWHPACASALFAGASMGIFIGLGIKD